MIRIFVLFFLLLYCENLYAVDLLQVYQDALRNDPVYQQALAQQLSNAQGVPINLASLLPNAGVVFTPFIAKTIASGSAVNVVSLPDGASASASSTARGYNTALTLNQPLLDFVKINKYLVAKEMAKQAQALANAAAEDLIIRVAKAYFSIVADEENLRAAGVIRAAYKKQYDQAYHRHKTGLTSIIDVHTAKASYEKSKEKYMTLEMMLTNDKEKLHMLTKQYYPDFAILKNRVPLINPDPNNVDQWVETAEQQNWDIKAAQYNKVAALRNIKQQTARHMPTLNLQGGYGIVFTRTIGDPIAPSTGSSKFNTSSASVSLNFPIFEGGQVVAEVDKAKYDYEVASEKLDKQFLETIDLTKENFYEIVARINKIKTGASLISATKKSLLGMEESYRFGNENLINVLNQRENLYEAERDYINDRYLYLVNFLTLKQAAGLLSDQDVWMVNNWLNHAKN
ncbi:MAG: hypothetical protein ACD_60C00090G0019 [uncultured bacterium]|nr:MAG: hypothetical protein ACD_60C00090G0019 [uncultured bacterium]